MGRGVEWVVKGRRHIGVEGGSESGLWGEDGHCGGRGGSQGFDIAFLQSFIRALECSVSVCVACIVCCVFVSDK